MGFGPELSFKFLTVYYDFFFLKKKKGKSYLRTGLLFMVSEPLYLRNTTLDPELENVAQDFESLYIS